MIVDAHVHVGTWEHPDFLGRGCTLAEALGELESAGVDGAAMMTTDRCENQQLLHEMKAAVAGGWRGPLWMLAWVRPGTDDLTWAREHAGELAGLKLHPSLSRCKVTDPGFSAAIELARERDLVALVHCGRWQEMASYRFAMDAAAEHRQVRFLLAHAGGDTPPLATAAAEMVRDRRLDNVWFDFAGLREYWVVERNVQMIGAERYLMGSDYSLAHPRMYVGAVQGMRLSARERALLLGGNALQLFGRPLSAGSAR